MDCYIGIQNPIPRRNRTGGCGHIQIIQLRYQDIAGYALLLTETFQGPGAVPPLKGRPAITGTSNNLLKLAYAIHCI